MLRRVLDAHPYPGLASTLRWDVLAWNRAASRLYGDFAARPERFRNGVWSMFLDPARRGQLPAWEEAAVKTVARFRLDAARAADRRDFDAIADELAALSPEFARLWNDYEVVEVIEDVKEVVHPTIGKIGFEKVHLGYVEPDGRELRISLYTPLPGDSEARARRLFTP